MRHISLFGVLEIIMFSVSALVTRVLSDCPLRSVRSFITDVSASPEVTVFVVPFSLPYQVRVTLNGGGHGDIQ
jgi:hypothetical protein